MWIVIKVPWWAKPLIIIGAFLAVTADGYLGRRKLEKMCQEQGGLHIYKTVDSVEGYEKDISLSPSWNSLDNGYSFIEGKSDMPGKVSRRTLNPDGTVNYEKAVTPQSQYLVMNLWYEKIDKNYSLYGQKIIDKKNGDVLAEAKSFGYRGGWVTRLISGLYASKSSIRCSSAVLEQVSLTYWDKHNRVKPADDFIQLFY